MIQNSTPESAGISRKNVEAFMAEMQKNRINLHSVLMLRGDKLFFEKYWFPYTADTPHRMYSVTKSFVAVAIGCLIDDGKLHLDDCIVDFFPDKLPAEVDPFLRKQTIRDMLTMRTCFEGFSWFFPEVTDRVKFYFSQKPVKVPGTIFNYDSCGSYVLGVLVERLSGMSLLEYLRQKVLNVIGGFENAEMLLTPDGTSWGDSALICTPRALLHFAKFVMNLGNWEGQQLMDADYLKQATTKQTDNNCTDNVNYDRWGYGYQIWMQQRNSFFLHGMGGQFAVCVPDKELVFVCTADVQLTDQEDKAIIHRAVFEHIVDGLDGNTPAAGTFDLEAPLALSVARGKTGSLFQSVINGTVFNCRENPMGITEFSILFGEDGNGVFSYVNTQGRKALPFGMGKNVFCKFPQFGYSQNYGNTVTTNGFLYNCAVSAGWVMERQLQIRVQVIDKYLGVLIITIDFRDRDSVSIQMCKSAENFLNEYEGFLIGVRREDTMRSGMESSPARPY